jgi:PASTA domain
MRRTAVRLAAVGFLTLAGCSSVSAVPQSTQKTAVTAGSPGVTCRAGCVISHWSYADSPKVVIPNVVGMSVTRAKMVLRRAGLRPGVISGQSNTVVTEQPRPGNKTPLGTFVVLNFP